MGNSYLELLYAVSGVLSSLTWVSNQLKVWVKPGSFCTFLKTRIGMLKES